MRGDARNAQSPRCRRIGTPLPWERNVCYASLPPCPPAAAATVLFVAASAQEDLLRAGNAAANKSPYYQGLWSPGRTGPFTLVDWRLPVVNFALPCRHPQNLPTRTPTSPTFIAHPSNNQYLDYVPVFKVIHAHCMLGMAQAGQAEQRALLPQLGPVHRAGRRDRVAEEEPSSCQRCHLTYSRPRAVNNQESKCRAAGFFSCMRRDGLP